MAFFGKKQKKEEGIIASATNKDVVSPKKEKKEEKPVVEKKAKKPSSDAGARMIKPPVQILKAPRITEKAVYMTMNHAYVFEVAQDATKRDIIAAVKALYGVTPRKVNIVRNQPRAFVARFRNRRGVKSGLKKAYVFLKKGEKIDLV
jgi:large subunit ribosomal protein L23